MRNPITKFVMAAAMTLLPALSYAQPSAGGGQGQGRGGDPEQMLNRQMAAMKEAVGLSDDQEKAIRPILANQQKKQRELMADGPTDESREAMMKMQAATKVQIKKVLKDDQMEKYDKYEAERANRRRGGGGPPPPPPAN